LLASAWGPETTPARSITLAPGTIRHIEDSGGAFAQPAPRLTESRFRPSSPELL
jgi:hypothetical protein